MDIERGESVPMDEGAGWSPTIAVLVLIAIAYGALQISVVDLERNAEWDEAVYLSQVDPDVPPTDFSAHRSRGITLLVAPTAAKDISVTRTTLVVLSSMLLAGSFATWIPIVGWGAPIGAAIFASSWVTLYYGSAVSPNLFGALVAVAAVGLVLRHLERPSRATLGIAAALLGVMALLRPLDAAVILAVTLGVGWAVLGRRAWATLTVLVVGFCAGVLPWLAEAFIRFGGPLSRLEHASGPVDAGPSFTVAEHLRLLDGSALVGPDPSATISAGAPVTWGLGLVLVGVAVVSSRSTRVRRGVATASIGAIALALPYFLWAGVAAPRFLLPAYALGSIAAAVGVIRSSRLVGWTGTAFVFIVFVLLVGWHMGRLTEVSERQSTATFLRHDVGSVLAVLADGRPCAFVSEFGYPEIQLASSCDGRRFDFARPEPALDHLRAQSEGTATFVIVINDPGSIALPPDGAIVASGWRIYEVTEIPR